MTRQQESPGETVPTAVVAAPGAIGEVPYEWPTNVPAPPAEVLQLWTEVGNGLEKSQTVVWKSAVESLDHANKTLQTSQDARFFLEKYMGQIIGILVEQQPNKIGPYERDCVHDSLSKAIEILAQDLDIQIRRNGECLLLPALGHVFNKKKPYYKGSKQAWNGNHVQGGLPETRMRMIHRFRQAEGFRLLHRYMVERIGTPAFPAVEHVHQILSATADAIIRPRNVVAAPAGGGGPANNQDPNSMIIEVEDDAIMVANAVMQSMNNLSDDDLKKMPVEQLQQQQLDLKIIFDKLVATRRASTRDFYAFWRGLTLRLITNPSLPLKLFGWDLVNELILACAEHRPPPRFYIVTNAGCPFVNGRFDYTGPVSHDGYFKPGADISYVRKIPEGEEQGGHKLTLFRCTMRSHQKWWFLSEADEEQPGTDRDIDYYQHKSKEHEEGAPPPRGWTTCRSAGMDPPPHLKQYGCIVPPGEEHNTLEHQLAKWAIENNIVEQVLGDTTIHREVVSRSTTLIKFLAQMCSRDDSPADAAAAIAGEGNIVEPNKYCLQASHLLYAWKTCTRKADAAVATQVYQLLVSILPLCPSDLGVPLLKAVKETLTEPNKDNHDYLFEVGEFCGALATGNLMEVKNGNGSVLPDEVREEALNLLWSVLTHPDAAALKSYDDLKRYVTHELRVEPKGSELRERFLQSCITALTVTAQLRGETPVDEDQALLMVKLTHFILEACPRQQSEECVTRDSGAVARLLFNELTAYLERKKKGPKTSYFRKSSNSSKTKKSADSTAIQQGLALHERLRILRHVYGLSAVRAGPTEPIVMSLEMVGTLWQLCDLPDDRESLMLFIASAAFTGKMHAEVTNHLPAGQPGVQAPDPNILLPAFTEDVCRAAFLSLYCSPDFNYSHLGDQGYRSFNQLFLHVRSSPVASAEDKKIALDAQWRVCLTAGKHSIATHAMRDLLSVYISASLNSVNPKPQPMMTDDIHESFGERISQCLATVKTELDEKAPGAERSTERCLRILNAAIGQQIDSGGYSMTPSTLTRLSQLPPTASLEDALRCLPHGMRGRASYIRIGVLAKCPQQQNQHAGQSPRHTVRDNGAVQPKMPSMFKFTLDVHPLETLHSVKYKVALHCQCPLSSVRPLQINGRSYGTLSGSPEQQLNFSSVPEDSVVDELGIVQGCEIVFVLAERQNNATVPAQSARGTFNNDLSGVFFNDDSKFADQLFYMLLGILESFPRKDPEQMSESESPPPTSVYQLVWDLIIAMPTNLTVASRVKAACGLAGDARSVTSAEDAMEVDSTAGDNWSLLLDTRNFNRSVYVLLMVDALLQPAPETLTILPHDLRVVLEKRLGEDANAFRRVFIDSGGFAAVVRFFSHPEGDDKAHTGEARRGNAVALRILKACLFGDGSDTPTTHDENVVPPDEAGSQLLRSLSDTEGLLKTLTSMVVDDSGISSSTIMDVLRFLRLLFRSKRAADSFIKLPDNLAKRLLVTLLTRDEESDTARSSSSISAALNVRNSVHDLILQTSHLADEGLPWLVDAVDHINFQSENASELFDTLERLVDGSDGTARSRAPSPKELRHLGTVVCQKLVSCPRPTSESEASDLSTAVLCGCLKLLRALINSSGGTVLREGADLLVKAIGIGRWSEANGASNRGVLALVASPFSAKTNTDDSTLVDLMGVVFDGFLTPLESASVSICCDKDSRCLGFEVVDAAARACRGGDGYMALVSRVDGLVSSSAPSLRHRWGQFGGGGDSHSRASRGTSKYSGLRNQGCTCYMNSALQQLFMMPELRDSMCNAPIPSNFRVSGGIMSSKGTELVGKKISLQWENAVAHDAIVEDFDEHTGMHTIRYCPVQVATVGSGHHQQVRPEDVERLPIAMTDEFVLSDGRPGKETGVFEVVPDPEPDVVGPVEREESDAMQDDEVKETEDESNSRHLLEEVQRTFIHLDEGSKGRCFDPRALVEACACLKLEFDVWQQNDASEFVTKLLDRLEISLKRWAPKNFEYMDHTFGLKQTQQKICKECGLKTNREEKLLSIDCQIRGKSDIHEALAAMTEADVMEGSNKVLCDRCKKKTDTILRTAISTLPNMLILSLKRFDLDFNTFETVKLNSRCAFGQTLNMKHYTLEALEALEKSESLVDPAPMDVGEGGHTEPAHDPLSALPDEDFEYKLSGVLVHAGVAQGGHYYSFIRDRFRGAEEKWYRFDDEDVTPFNPSLIENECFGGKVKKETKWPNGQVHTVEQEQFANALMLFYEKVKPSDCPDDTEHKDSDPSPPKTMPPPKTMQTSTGYDVFKPDVRRSNATHRWQSFLFDTEFQNFLKGMLQICETSVAEQSPDTWRAPLVQTLLTFVFDVMLYSSDRSSLHDWTHRLEHILLRDAQIARSFTHKLAKKTDAVSGNWLRTYLLDCPDRASRSSSVTIFSAAMKNCASISTELRTLDLWAQGWREMMAQELHERKQEIHPYPSSLTGQWKCLENPDTLDGGESSCLGIILSFTNILLDYMPRCWRFSTELCLFIRSLASMKSDDQRHIFRRPMVEALIPARIICIVSRERSSRFLQLAFPGAAIPIEVANTQTRIESNTSNVMAMGGNQVMGQSDINNGRQGPFDNQMLLEAFACLVGLPGVVSKAVTKDIEESGRGRNRTVLTDAAIDALKAVFFEHCTPGTPGMMQREIELYLRSSGVDANAASSQKIADMMAKYPVTSVGAGEKGIAYLSVEGFLAYYRDLAQTNEMKVILDLHRFGFRPDLTRRSRNARFAAYNDRETERLRAEESVAIDVAENLDQRAVNLGPLTNECFNSTHLFLAAFDGSEPLALYLIAAAVYKRGDPELTIHYFLKLIHGTPNDWNSSVTVSQSTHALTVIACIPDEDQMARIAIIMQSSSQAARNSDYGVGLLNVIRSFYRSRQAQHYNNDHQWGLDRYMTILKKLRRVYPIQVWMNNNRDKWSYLERDILDERPAVMHHHHHAQPRGDYGTRDVENHHMPLDHHSHTDSDMADMNDSEDDDENTTDVFVQESNDGPYQIIIDQAGTLEVNGVYSQDGYFENACKYSRDGKWKNADYRFLIFQCNVSNNTKHWYISIVPYAGNPGTSSDIDFYSAPATPECMRIPPPKGWVKAPEGLEPSPTLTYRVKQDDVIGAEIVGNNEEQQQQQQDEENEENQSWPMEGPGDEPDENITGTGSTSSSGGGGGPGAGNGVQDLRNTRYV